MTTTKKKTTATKSTTLVVKKKVDEIVELPANPFAFEVLALAAKQKSNAKKAEILQRYSDPSLKTILIWNFDETIVSLLPEGLVPYASVGQQNVRLAKIRS